MYEEKVSSSVFQVNFRWSATITFQRVHPHQRWLQHQPIKAAAFMLTKCLKKRAFIILLHFGSGPLVLLVLAVVGGGIYKGVLDIKNIVLR